MKVLLQLPWSLGYGDFNDDHGCFFKVISIPTPLHGGMGLWVYDARGEPLWGEALRVKRIDWDETCRSWVTARLRRLVVDGRKFSAEQVVTYMTASGWSNGDYPDEYPDKYHE
jgi:hypothetical protein